MPFFVGCLACFSAPAGEADDTCTAGLPSPCTAYTPGPGPGPLQQEHELQLKGVLILPSMSGFSLGCTTASTRPSIDLPAVGTEGLRVFRTLPSRLSVDSHALGISYAATSLSVEGQGGAGCVTPASGLTIAAQQQQQQQQQASAGQLSARQLCTTRFNLVGPTAALTASEADQPFRTTTSLSSCPCHPAASTHAAGARQQEQQQQGQQQQRAGELLQGDTPSDAARRLLTRNRSCRSIGYIGREAPLSASSSCSSILLQPTYAQPSGCEHGALLLLSSPRQTPLLPPSSFKHDVISSRDPAQGPTMAT